MEKYNRKEVDKRRTFGIISHPDAGKTTLTEKLLLFGGAIQQAGAVKARKAARHAVSDWMEIEKERGISITTSVMKFRYRGFEINLLDSASEEEELFSQRGFPRIRMTNDPEGPSFINFFSVIFFHKVCLFPQADCLRCHLNQFVLIDICNAFFKAHLCRGCQDYVLIRS